MSISSSPSIPQVNYGDSIFITITTNVFEEKILPKQRPDFVRQASVVVVVHYSARQTLPWLGRA